MVQQYEPCLLVVNSQMYVLYVFANYINFDIADCDLLHQ
jgi:hypothetical protein